MDELMKEECDQVCFFMEPFEVDFDYEFDVAKYFDFLRVETIDEIEDSQRWFYLAEGHPPSPILVKLGLVTEDHGGSDTSSPKYAYSVANDGGESEVLSRNQTKKGPELLRSKSMNQSRLSKSSRLLQPTASLLAKQNHQISVRGMRGLGRVQKPGSPIKTPGDIAATKRQKLEHGYLLKVAHLKHQANFSHKVPKKVGSSNVSSCHTKLKVTVPKEPCLETATRAQRHRSKNVDSCSVSGRPSNTKISEPKLKRTQSLIPQLQVGKAHRPHTAKGATQNGRSLTTKRSKSFNASMYEQSDQRCKARPLTKKNSLSKGDISGLHLNSKTETIGPKEIKTTNSKKLTQTPLVELFSELSLDSENQSGSVLEDDQTLQTKGLKKNVQCSMKENKNANRKSTRSSPKQSQIGGGRMTVI